MRPAMALCALVTLHACAKGVCTEGLHKLCAQHNCAERPLRESWRPTSLAVLNCWRTWSAWGAVPGFRPPVMMLLP